MRQFPIENRVVELGRADLEYIAPKLLADALPAQEGRELGEVPPYDGLTGSARVEDSSPQTPWHAREGLGDLLGVVLRHSFCEAARVENVGPELGGGARERLGDAREVPARHGLERRAAAQHVDPQRKRKRAQSAQQVREGVLLDGKAGVVQGAEQR